MKKTILFLLLALPAIAENPTREAFPSDYKPSPCAADTAAVCQSFVQSRMTEYGATFRGFNLSQEWVNAHWDEMTKLFTPLCAKIANCFTVKGNDWVFCVDLLRADFLATCDRYPANSEDRTQCTMFALTYYIGLGAKTKLHATAQECIGGEAAPAERSLEAWIEPQTFVWGVDGELTVHAYDAETHIPVRARLTIDGGTLRSTEGPVPTTGYPSKWRAGLKRVPNTQGHRDVVAPTATLTANGYQTLTFPIAIDVPALIVAMTPPVTQLKRGMNTITVTAHDAATGEPVRMRVMAGDRVLGNTNTPLPFEVKRGEKRPEIWVTSLWDRYSDVVVAGKTAGSSQ